MSFFSYDLVPFLVGNPMCHYGAARTAMVTSSRLRSLVPSGHSTSITIGTALPGVTPSGMKMLIWLRPTLVGCRTAPKTCASTPPTNTRTVLVVTGTVPPRGMSPAGGSGLTGPRPSHQKRHHAPCPNRILLCRSQRKSSRQCAAPGYSSLVASTPRTTAMPPLPNFSMMQQWLVV